MAARAESARIELGASAPQAALKVLDAGREISGRDSADLDFALLETYLALWRVAQNDGNEAVSKSWREKTLAIAKFIEQRHGAYWARRSELLLVNSAPRTAGGRDMEILARSADNLYLEGMFDEAVAAYETAWATSQRIRRSDAGI